MKRQTYSIKPRTFLTKVMVGALAGVVAVPLALVVQNGKATAACTAPATDYGKVTASVSVPSAATYRIWSRIMVPDTTNKTYLLEVDGGNCYNVGGGTLTANTWVWVDYQGGTTSSKVQQSLTAGSHTLKLIGNAAGVKVDRVIATSDTACTPTGDGNNCNTPSDMTAPTVTLTAPKEGASVSGTVTLSATATDNTSVSKVEFYDNTTLITTDTTSPYSASWNSTGATNGSHLITARAYDPAGNMGTDSSTVTTKNGDVQLPGTPSGLAASALSYSSIRLTWKASTDNIGVTGYVIMRDGVPVTTVGAVTTYTDTNLNANTSYGYQVQALDAAGNKSALSTRVTAKTPNVADSQAPSTVSGLSGQSVSPSQVNLSWTAATDNIGVTSYDVYRSTGSADPQLVGSSNAITYGDPALAANTTYAYYVVAKDAAGNAAQPSDTITVTTQQQPAESTHSRIVGTITDQASSKPVRYARVKILVDGHKQVYVADWWGRYAMHNLKIGHYNVIYKANAYYSQTIAVQLGQAPITQNVSLKKR
ncbi:MAG TPA: Ig-like domain-containing protein [Candidatus Saccharimonadales bacterium]|nr:Ig-like domain-containing protein [Candidatus Saccharimonadales bacterium]